MPRQTIAEKYRQHRREFVLAQELGCTPIEARFALRRRDKGAVGEHGLEASTVKRLRDLPDEAWMMRDR